MLDFEPERSRSVYANAKYHRKNLENDQRIIENRIRMIKFEEARALKRIQETRERISELYKTKTRYFEQIHKKNISKERQAKNLEETREAIRNTKTFQEEKLNYLKQEVYSMKQNIGKRVRGWKEYIKRTNHQQKLDLKRENRKIKETVKLMSKQGEMRLKLLEDLRGQKAHSEYSRKVNYENNKRLDAEKLLDDMGKEEQILMERLKSVHEAQKQAAEDLEKVYT